MSDESITLNFDINTGKLMRAMTADDDIGAIVRLHLEIDRALVHIIKAMVPAPEHFRMRFTGQRINFLRALGLPNLRLEPVSVINSVRNKFAHEDRETILEADVLNLKQAVEALYARKLPDTFEVRYHKKDGSERRWVYREMNHKERFCFLGSLALAGLAAVEKEFAPIAFRQLPRFGH